MTESSEEPNAVDRRADPGDADDAADAADPAGGAAHSESATATDAPDSESADLEALRREVEETYDFDDFGPEDMAEMSLEEWEAAFDPGTWIVGEELLDRVEHELKARVAIREIFAIVERVSDGEEYVVAYSDEGYAVVYADGSVEGEGTVLRDVKPTVALCSMESYELMDAPADASLPEPEEVVEGSGEFGNLMLQVVAGAQIVVGLGLLIAWIALPSLSTVVAPIAALGFLVIGFFLFLVVANARLSDRFRTEEFRNRLRALEAADAPRPDGAADRKPAAGVVDDAGDGTEASDVAPPDDSSDDDARSSQTGGTGDEEVDT
ncbi:DUF7319 domain-containing protein [Halobellus limi]|uniref:DUF7319 domain-containing protein n=1 Tax=Halobellus limi TaxID=699433 RepID=A0A1H5Z2B6_9EURY|nr:hypothetical protein [Halobellus limi]QCC48266.1 hypothetical protein DV707_11675 [Halobellus limi]SEG29775.1 hypothetical protein SAMN04488133_1797 [Halobellus limi]